LIVTMCFFAAIIPQLSGINTGNDTGNDIIAQNMRSVKRFKDFLGFFLLYGEPVKSHLATK